MRIVLGALGAAMFLGSAAMAQTPGADPGTAAAPAAPAVAVPSSRCPAFPPEPDLPDGATVRGSREMQQGDRTYQAWGTSMQSVLDCRRTEAQELQQQAQLVSLQAQTRVTEYNEAVQRLNAVGQAWQAEATEFNERNGRR